MRHLPGEEITHSVVPDGAQDHAGDAGDVPGNAGDLEILGETDIGPGAEGACDAEADETERDIETFQPAVAVGDLVVEEEIARHGGEGRPGLRVREAQVKTQIEQREAGHVHDKPKRTDERKNNEARRQRAARQFAQDEEQVFDADADIELAAAVDAVAEMVADFTNADGPFAGGENIEQDFEAAAVQAVHNFAEEALAKQEEAAHWIRQFASEDGTADALAETAQEYTAGGEVAHAAAIGISGGDDDIERLFLQLLQHAGEDALVVLKIGVHHGNTGGGSGENSFDAGGGETAAADTTEQTNAAIFKGVRGDEVRSAVGRIVIDEDDFPIETFESGGNAGDDFGDVLPFIEGGEDDGDIDLARCGAAFRYLRFGHLVQSAGARRAGRFNTPQAGTETHTSLL